MFFIFIARDTMEFWNQADGPGISHFITNVFEIKCDAPVMTFCVTSCRSNSSAFSSRLKIMNRSTSKLMEELKEASPKSRKINEEMTYQGRNWNTKKPFYLLRLFFLKYVIQHFKFTRKSIKYRWAAKESVGIYV